ncbi:MAG: PQQ-binding-like beta-propeller repeat protein, partial [Opitutales bacterium]|nr:PQQ-binding-like beta-propeller repeat protein [Opitutales bacterium]
LNRPNVIPNIDGGAEWTGGCTNPHNGMLYLNSNQSPRYITLTPTDEDFVDETKLEPTPGRKVYESVCIVCHGPNREGSGEFPALIKLNRRMKDEQVIEMLKTGRNFMPPAPLIQGQELQDLLDYLMDRDRPELASESSDEPERPYYKFHGFKQLLDQDGYHGSKPPWGLLNAIDLNTGKIKWQIPFGEYEALTEKGIPVTGILNFGGASVTAGGLLFCSGGHDQTIRAYDVDNGEELWKRKMPYVGSAPASIYEAEGKQYIVVPATGCRFFPELPKGDAFVAFTLDE